MRLERTKEILRRVADSLSRLFDADGILIILPHLNIGLKHEDACIRLPLVSALRVIQIGFLVERDNWYVHKLASLRSNNTSSARVLSRRYVHSFKTAAEACSRVSVAYWSWTLSGPRLNTVSRRRGFLFRHCQYTSLEGQARTLHSDPCTSAFH